MSDDEIGPDVIQALIEEVGVDPMEGDPDWNAQIWIPEYAEPVLGQELFEGLEARLRAIPGVERLAWEDREVFLVRVARGTNLEDVQAHAVATVKSAVHDAGHAVS